MKCVSTFYILPAIKLRNLNGSYDTARAQATHLALLSRANWLTSSDLKFAVRTS